MEGAVKGCAAEEFADLWRGGYLGVRSTAVSLSSCVMECYRNFNESVRLLIKTVGGYYYNALMTGNQPVFLLSVRFFISFIYFWEVYAV